MDLMTAFSEIVLAQFRSLAKDAIAQAENELLALTAEREDRFLASHACDVFRELQSATLSIQVSFCSELSRNFIAFVHQDRTWSGHEPAQTADCLNHIDTLAFCRCQRSCAPWLQELASHLRGLDPAAPPAGDQGPLPIGPDDILAAFMRAILSIHLPIHPKITRCLAGVMARKLEESAASVYEQFALALHGDAYGFATRSLHPAGEVPSSSDKPEPPASLGHGDSSTATVQLSADTDDSSVTNTTAKKPMARPSFSQNSGFPEGIGRFARLRDRSAAGKSANRKIGPMSRRTRSRKAGHRHDFRTGWIVGNAALRRLGYTGAIYLATVLLIFGANHLRNTGEQSDDVVKSIPSDSPSSLSPPVNEAAAMNRVVPDKSRQTSAASSADMQ